MNSLLLKPFDGYREECRLLLHMPEIPYKKQ
jgi:hypothetical protein